jgi:UDP-2,3-diacylglucosamine pyrophosphatase LpxH
MDRPDFVITVGDSIQGGDDLTMDREWQQFSKLLEPYRHFRIFFTPGNHDIWSLASSQAYEKYSKRPPHYSFDYKQAHFVVLDNSRSDQMPAEELAYLKQDLEMHEQQPLKFVFSHRPSWILQTVLSNPQFPLHQIAKQYGVHFMIAGHIHQMLSFDLEGIRYLSMASSGGHLRASKKYEDGWFFAHSLATVKGNSVTLEIKELGPPFGQGRITGPGDWGPAGLTK